MKTATVPTFTCEVCNTTFKDKDSAMKCESMPIEQPSFNIGDTVVAYEKRTDTAQKEYYLVGYVVDAVVEPPDQEYIRKWLGRNEQHRLKMHNLVYLVNIDPKEDDGHRYYAPEIGETKLTVGKRYDIDKVLKPKG